MAYFHKDSIKRLTSCKETEKDWDKKDCDKEDGNKEDCNKDDCDDWKGFWLKNLYL